MSGKEAIRGEEKRALSKPAINALKRVDGVDKQISTARQTAASAQTTATGAVGTAATANSNAGIAYQDASDAHTFAGAANQAAADAITQASLAQGYIGNTYTALGLKAQIGHNHNNSLAVQLSIAGKGLESELEQRVRKARTLRDLRAVMLDFIKEIKDAR